MFEEKKLLEMNEVENITTDNSEVVPLSPVSSGNISAVIEGLLYIVGEDGLSLDRLSAVLDMDEEWVERELQKISADYQKNKRGIELVSYAGKYKLVSKDFVYPYAQQLFHNYKPDTLSQSALETLAIIAYKQPVTRVEIEELRGVGCEVMLRKMLLRGFIREAGRSEAPGRPILYEVTDEFLDSFELVSLDELPDLPKYDDQEVSDLFAD